jgi:manganese transport protein
MQLPFAVIPLIHFTGDRTRMGSFANAAWVRAVAWLTAAIIIVLNVRLVVLGVGEWLGAAGRYRPLVWIVVVPLSAALASLLLWVALEPYIRRLGARFGRIPITLPETAAETAVPVYQRILVPLDHTDLDRKAVAHAAAMAHMYEATLYLVHVEEGVTSQVYGPEASTAEVEAGEKYLERIAESLRAQSVKVETAVFHSADPRKEIVRYARRVRPDLLIMGAHGHGGLKDLIFGNTINPVRHDLNVPLLIVR